MRLIDRAQVTAIILATLSIVVVVGVPRPYSVYLFWTMLGAALVLWLVSIRLRLQLDEFNAQEAKAEVITTVGLAIAFFLAGWLIGWLTEDISSAWLFGFLAGIVGFIVALAPLRKSPPRQRDDLPGDE
jgi:hypothetical protein